MADHVHKKNEIMFSYRFMRMSMAVKPHRLIRHLGGRDRHEPNQSIRQPTHDAADAEGRPRGHDDGHAHVRGHVRAERSHHADGDDDFIEKSMDHITYQGPMGTNRLGRFTTETRGLGDTSIAPLIKPDPYTPLRAHET